MIFFVQPIVSFHMKVFQNPLSAIALMALIYLSTTPTAFCQERDQYVILISLDGFRNDYVERFQPKNLKTFIDGGVAAEALVPSFPTKTFPNHYTIATGMKPENHGLVNNTFYDPRVDKVYSIGNREVVQDKYFYGGTPLWVLAEQNGLTAASYFFVGTEAPVQDVYPTYYHIYDGSVPNLQRISKVFEWLNLPEDERPRLITLYFSDMDDVGHLYGPNNDEKLLPVLNVLDAQLGALFEGLKSFDLDINIILVSDHGMAELKKENLINLEEIVSGLPVDVYNNGALAHLHLKNPKDRKKAWNKIQKQKGNFKVVDIEDREFYQNIEPYRERLGDFLILADLNYWLAFPSDFIRYQQKGARFNTEVFGEHGYSPEYEEMYGIFYANGPAFKKGTQVQKIDNVDVFPIVCKILGLPIPDEIDGKLIRVEHILE